MKLDNIDAAFLSSRSMPAPGRTRRAGRALEHGDRPTAEGTGGRRFHPWLSGSSGFGALRSLHHRSGQGNPGKPKRRCVEIVRSRGHRLSIGGSMLPDVGKRRLHRHCPGVRYRGLRTQSQNRTLPLPRVARIQSSFAMREVVNRAVPPVIFGESRRLRSGHPAR